MRIFTVYEQNLLRKFNFDPYELARNPLYFHTPVEYIIGHAEFCDELFFVTPDTLIPRIETQQLVDIAFNLHTDQKFIKFADVGCGSGCVGITLAKKFFEANINFYAAFIDKSRYALDITRANIINLLSQFEIQIEKDENVFYFNKYPSTIKIIEHDVTCKLKLKGIFDFIVANLPYIPTDRIPYLDYSVKNYEPKIALDGGKDGFQIINKFLLNVRKLTKTVILEVDDTHDERFIIQNYPKLKTLFKFKFVKDCFKKQRFIIAATR